MKVFKFGGASVKSADAVRNVAEVMKRFQGEQVAVIISAMGKTTNALEKLNRTYMAGEDEAAALLEEIRQFHLDILKDLFESPNHPVYTEVNNAFVEIEWAIEDEPTGTFDFEYDQIVSVGELISTKIVSAFLKEAGLDNRWIDVRDFVRTDNSYRNAKVDWTVSQELADRSIAKFFADDNNPGVSISQGFTGVTSENYTTTLGREGSDYSAAILAYLLGAEEVVIWKDVPGVLNADPKYFDDTVLLPNISYKESIELAYYGASVIHPKTIQPLQNKGIPLRVRSFANPDGEGSVINENTSSDSLVPSYIVKQGQALISIAPRDFAFIVEDNLSGIFDCFARHKVSINVMQNSAISFSVAVDWDDTRVPQLLDELKSDFSVRYNRDLELVTIRHYDQQTIDKVTEGKTTLLEQRTRNTVRILLQA